VEIFFFPPHVEFEICEAQIATGQLECWPLSSVTLWAMSLRNAGLLQKENVRRRAQCVPFQQGKEPILKTGSWLNLGSWPMGLEADMERQIGPFCWI
jgi:hypothetical protein